MYKKSHFNSAKVSAAVKDAGYRSGLEMSIATQLHFNKMLFDYEQLTLEYLQPAIERKYKPDFVLANGIIIEAKGIFDVEDRKKHLLIKAQYPNADIRFIFSNSKETINKRSETSYAQWCQCHGYLYADKIIPVSWLREPRKEVLQHARGM